MRERKEVEKGVKFFIFCVMKAINSSPFFYPLLSRHKFSLPLPLTYTLNLKRWGVTFSTFPRASRRITPSLARVSSFTLRSHPYQWLHLFFFPPPPPPSLNSVYRSGVDLVSIPSTTLFPFLYILIFYFILFFIFIHSSTYFYFIFFDSLLSLVITRISFFSLQRAIVKFFLFLWYLKSCVKNFSDGFKKKRKKKMWWWDCRRDFLANTRGKR